jgi:conjugative transfer signal peptidase TraF
MFSTMAHGTRRWRFAAVGKIAPRSVCGTACVHRHGHAWRRISSSFSPSFHLRIMLTDSSAPAGIYHLSAAPERRGALVAACLPAAVARTGIARGYLSEGDCPAGAEPVAKVIGALAGDDLDIEPSSVAINGVKFPNSQTAPLDSAGRPLAHVLSGARRVAAGEVWLFGFNNARSWDGRYFGPVPAMNVRGVLRPVVTW